MATAFQRLISVIAASGSVNGPLLAELQSLSAIEATQAKEIAGLMTDRDDLKARVATLEAQVAGLDSNEADDEADEKATFPIVITPAAPLLAATVGTPFSQQFTAENGVGPYTFTATGVPADGTFSEQGLLEVTSTAPEEADIIVTATDSTGFASDPQTYHYSAS